VERLHKDVRKEIAKIEEERAQAFRKARQDQLEREQRRSEIEQKHAERVLELRHKLPPINWEKPKSNPKLHPGVVLPPGLGPWAWSWGHSSFPIDDEPFSSFFQTITGPRASPYVEVVDLRVGNLDRGRKMSTHDLDKNHIAFSPRGNCEGKKRQQADGSPTKTVHDTSHSAVGR
jgi:hypothetical protein